MLYWVNKISTNISILICGVIYLFLSSISTDSLIDGTQSGKSFFFLVLMMMIAVVTLLRILTNRAKCLKVRLLDWLLILWALYVIGNGFLQESPTSLRLLEFYGLIVLYIALNALNALNVLSKFSNNTIKWLYAALIIGGTIQAIYGNLQLWGYYPSHHSLFKITGSFFNPGPYAGYISSVFTVTLGFFIFKIRSRSPKRILRINGLKWRALLKILMWVATGFMSLALAATHSRAALLALSGSLGFLLYNRYRNKINLLFNSLVNLPAKKLSLTVLAIILSGFLFTSLYYLKKDSANGRLLIWKVSLNMIGDKPVFGYGFDQFKVQYMDYQADFFKHHPDSNQVMVAGDTNYAFNEPLQLTVENGIFGLAILMCIFFFIFKSRRKVTQTNTGYLSHDPDKAIDKNCLLVIAKAGLINIFVFSLFSYPAQILPIKISLVLYLATVANHSPQIKFTLFNFLPQKIIHRTMLAVKLMLVFVFLILTCAGSLLLYKQAFAFRYWKNAYQSYQFGVYDACLKDYQKAYPALETNGNFLTNYGKALSEAGKPSKAITVLKQAKKTYPNTIVYTAMGNSYKALNQYDKAEQAYLQAWQMNPSRFYPKYLLAKLYDQTGQQEKAVHTAKELLHKKIKVESEAIREIKAEMNEIINKKKRNAQ